MSRELHGGGPVDMHHSQEVEDPGVISQWEGKEGILPATWPHLRPPDPKIN